MPWANNEDWAKKKNVDVPPDMGLEPMTLRLKVWCSTDWANRAGLQIILPSKYRVRFSSERLYPEISQFGQISELSIDSYTMFVWHDYEN